MPSTRRRPWLTPVLTLGAAVLAGVLVWSGVTRAGTPRMQDASRTLRILASSDLHSMGVERVLTGFTGASGIRVDLDFVGGDELTRRLRSPRFDRSYDAVWLGTGDERRAPEVESHLEGGTATMRSPILLGLRRSSAERLGWDPARLTWGQIVSAARAGRFHFAMLDPRDSAAGESALLAVAADLSGTRGVLTAEDARAVGSDLRALALRQAVGATVTEQLVQDYLLAEEGEVDALVTTEAEILRINETAEDPLLSVAPGGRASITDYTLRPLLLPRSRETGSHVRRLAAYLGSPRGQRRILESTGYRAASLPAYGAPRPAASRTSVPTSPRAASRKGPAVSVVPGGRVTAGPSAVAPGVVAPAAAVPAPRDVLIPRDETVAERLVEAYAGDGSGGRMRTILVLDTSASMRGRALRDLGRRVRAAGVSVDGDVPREAEVVVLPFASRPAGEPRTVRLGGDDPERALRSLEREIGRSRPGGRSAIYEALVAAYGEVEDTLREDPTASVSVVLVSDGHNTGGRGYHAFLRWRRDLPEHVRGVPVDYLRVGYPGTGRMRDLVRVTGGRVLDARTADLGGVLYGTKRS